MGFNPSYLLFACLLSLIGHGASADLSISTVPVSDDIISLEAGILCPPETVGTNPAPGTITGATHVIAESPPFAANIRQVPATLGLAFGIKAQTRVPGGLNGITMTITHPPMGPEKVSEQSFTSRINDDDPSLTFFQFDHSYELVEGEWSMMVTHADMLLYKVDFTVLPPEALPEIAGLCGYLDLLS
ncbi:DUF3859 domain-containing protein [Yoonia sp. BS5-3]|uniref:DUF3859 domain-containing protein n=1 Tax=Yoonia phaeophyticola TaxID=3137369 RepID=A0ABZ2V7F7_9RHOB